jgi:hypothetical protein
MPTINDLKQSRFLTKGDVGKGMLLTIKGWHEENVAMTGDAPEKKYCLDFDEIDKPLVLNTTKGNVIAQICGNDDFDAWTGYRIVAFHDPNISMGGKLVGGISVRAPRIAPPPAPVPTAPVARAPAPVRPMTGMPLREPVAELPPGAGEDDSDVPF